MKLTEKEKEVIKRMREDEEADKPKLIGTLKHDLYIPYGRDCYLTFHIGDILENSSWTLTKDDIHRINARVNNTLENLIKETKGQEFLGYFEDGEYVWYGFNLECMSQKWAEKHLENIRPIEKKKSSNPENKISPYDLTKSPGLAGLKKS